MAIKPSKRSIVYFDAQVLLGEKTGVGYFCHTLIAQLAAVMPETRFVGHAYDFMLRSKADLPKASNISYVRNPFLPIQFVNLLRRFRVEIPLELRIFRRAAMALHLNYLSVPSLFRTPAIGFIYDMCFADHPEFVSKKNRQDLTRFVPDTLRRCSHIVTISNFTAERLRNNYPTYSNDMIILPIPPAPAADITATLSDRLIDLGVRSKKYVLYIGTLEPRKNIVGLVRAYKCLSEKIRAEYSLVLAGGKGWNDEDTQATIQEAEDAGLQVIRTGYVSQFEKIALYRHAACFVLPSHYEGFGMPIFEAMQQNIPVAVTDIPVFHEVAGDAAIYFKQTDPTDITKILTKLLADDPLRQTLIQKGQERLTGFSWSANIRTMQSLLDSMLRTR